MKTEFELDCPWCSSPMTVAAESSTTDCTTCSIVVDLAPDPIVEHVALAA